MTLEGRYQSIKCFNRFRCPFETALLILLYRFSRPRILRLEMEEFFGMCQAHLSAVLDKIVEGMYTLAFFYFTNPAMFVYKIPYYTAKIYDKNGLLEHLWGFVDGTLHKIA